MFIGYFMFSRRKVSLEQIFQRTLSCRWLLTYRGYITGATSRPKYGRLHCDTNKWKKTRQQREGGRGTSRAPAPVDENQDIIAHIWAESFVVKTNELRLYSFVAAPAGGSAFCMSALYLFWCSEHQKDIPRRTPQPRLVVANPSTYYGLFLTEWK